MKPGLFMPDPTTSWSTRPKRVSAVSSIALASSSESGRRTMVSTSPPTSRTSAATSSSSPLVPEASTSLPPSAPSAIAQPRPKAPEAPVTIATLPLLSNSDNGLRSCSEIMGSLHRTPPRTSPLSSPRRRGPITTDHQDYAGCCSIACSRRMGPRLRGDDNPNLSLASSSPPRLKSKRLLRIKHRDHPQRTALAVRPAPWECKEGAALAGDLVDVAADVFDAGDAVGHHDLVRRLPIREILDDVTAGRGLVFDIEMRLRRARSMRPQERTERMIERLHVDADELDAALNDPFGGLFVEPGRIGVVVRIVAIVQMTSRVDHQDVVLANLRLGVLEILWRDHAPLALRDRDRDAGAEEAPERIAGQRRLVLLHMDRRIHVGAAMHDAFELLHQQAILGMKFDHTHVKVRARGPLRHAVAPAMSEIVDLKIFRARRHSHHLALSLRHARLYAGHPRLSF